LLFKKTKNKDVLIRMNYSIVLLHLRHHSGGIKQRCVPSICPSVCLSHSSNVLELIGNTNRKLHTGNRTRRSKWPYRLMTGKDRNGFPKYGGGIRIMSL